MCEGNMHARALVRKLFGKSLHTQGEIMEGFAIGGRQFDMFIRPFIQQTTRDVVPGLQFPIAKVELLETCLLYTSDAADE